MLATAIIVFREVLEAALIVGIVLAASRGVSRRGAWVGGGIGAGILGAMAVAGYAARAGLDVSTYSSQLGPTLTPEIAGKSFVELATNSQLAGSFMLTAGGLAPAP